MCYGCYDIRMVTISHRDFRNNSGKVLDRVRHGETIGVTNHGELAALLVPPNLAKIDQLVASGRVRRARLDAPLGFDVRVESVLSTAEVLADLRRDR
jgi:prevent-host-death family protein